jgi:hypothetical protein
MNLFLGFEMTGNFLVDSLLRNMATVIDRTDRDEKNSEFSICYYYNFIHDVGAGKYWRYWLISKATINYYHVVFAPKLIEKDNSREVLRLSNRFPEYERAVEYLKRVRETLFLASPCDREKTDRFFKLQLADEKKEVLAVKKPIGKYVPPFYCQCRVCGLIFMSPIKIAGKGKGKGQAIKICSSQNCEKAWDVFRNSLPLIPNDSEGRKVCLSYL